MTFEATIPSSVTLIMKQLARLTRSERADRLVSDSVKGEADMAKLRWYKGNIHTHTTESDGDADPEKVVGWYRRHGYDFLVLSDHNHLTIFE